MPSIHESNSSSGLAECVDLDEERPTYEERRTSERNCRKLVARLAGLRGRAEVRCPAENISENGMYVRVPMGCGLAVGERYEVALAEESSPSQSDNLIGEGCYATVVRTERLERESGDLVGAGLRFDQPLFL